MGVESSAGLLEWLSQHRVNAHHQRNGRELCCVFPSTCAFKGAFKLHVLHMTDDFTNCLRRSHEKNEGLRLDITGQNILVCGYQSP